MGRTDGILYVRHRPSGRPNLTLRAAIASDYPLHNQKNQSLTFNGCDARKRPICASFQLRTKYVVRHIVDAKLYEQRTRTVARSYVNKADRGGPVTDSYASVDAIWLDGLEFCSRVYVMHEALMRRPDAGTRLRLRPTDFEKKLLEELLPLCRYIQTVYGPGRHLSVRWLSGDQSYDAEYLQRGAIVENRNLPTSGHIEITGAMHPNEHLLRERLESHGHAFAVDGLSAAGTKRRGNRVVDSEVRSHTDPETIATMTALVVQSIQRKAGRYANHTTLIVECTLNTLYLEDHWRDLIAAVNDARPEHSFDGIFICSVPYGYIASLGLP